MLSENFYQALAGGKLIKKRKAEKKMERLTKVRNYREMKKYIRVAGIKWN